MIEGVKTRHVDLAKVYLGYVQSFSVAKGNMAKEYGEIGKVEYGKSGIWQSLQQSQDWLGEWFPSGLKIRSECADNLCLRKKSGSRVI